MRGRDRGALMGRRAGSADLPLHDGRVPKWLGERMTRLGAVITEAIVLEHGRDELLRRLAQPFWVQSFAAGMRMDWLSEDLQSFVEEPHAAIDGVEQGVIVNLTDRRAGASRQRQHDILAELGPDGIERHLAKLEGGRVESPGPEAQPMLPHLVMPGHHEVRPEDIVTRRLHGNLAAAAECGPQDFSELLLVPGVGARTVRALAQVAEVVHGAPYRFSDPARFSIAHGGKDRHPYPLPLKVYDRTIGVLKTAVQKAKLDQSEELAAIKRLDEQSRRLERRASRPSVEALFAKERGYSHAYGGRSVFGVEPPPNEAAPRSGERIK